MHVLIFHQVSYLEIYCERVRDLLSPKAKNNLRVRWGWQGLKVVQNLTIVLYKKLNNEKSVKDKTYNVWPFCRWPFSQHLSWELYSWNFFLIPASPKYCLSRKACNKFKCHVLNCNSTQTSPQPYFNLHLILVILLLGHLRTCERVRASCHLLSSFYI